MYTKKRPCEATKRMWPPGKTKKEISEETKPFNTSVLDLWPPKLWENKRLLFKPPSPWCFVNGYPRKLIQLGNSRARNSPSTPSLRLFASKTPVISSSCFFCSHNKLLRECNERKGFETVSRVMTPQKSLLWQEQFKTHALYHSKYSWNVCGSKWGCPLAQGLREEVTVFLNLECPNTREPCWKEFKGRLSLSCIN